MIWLNLISTSQECIKSELTNLVSAMAPMQHNFCVFADEIEAVIKF